MSAAPVTPSSDVIVVGGGIVGLWVAHDLARAGARVNVYELYERITGVGEGCSWGNAGWLACAPDSGATRCARPATA